MNVALVLNCLGTAGTRFWVRLTTTDWFRECKLIFPSVPNCINIGYCYSEKQLRFL